MKTITLERWRTPASEIPRGIVGSAQIRTYWYPPATYNCYGQRNYDYFRATKRLYVTGLAIDGETWMVDDPPHWWAMEDHATHYSGHVLVAGLGLGMIVHTLTANPAVERITVVEREQDVIDYVSPHVPHDKLEIVCDDWFELDPDTVGEVDGIFFDLFVGNSHQLLAAAVQVTIDMLERFSPERDVPTRVHGFGQGMIRRTADSVRDFYRQRGMSAVMLDRPELRTE